MGDMIGVRSKDDRIYNIQKYTKRRLLIRSCRSIFFQVGDHIFICDRDIVLALHTFAMFPTQNSFAKTLTIFFNAKTFTARTPFIFLLLILIFEIL